MVAHHPVIAHPALRLQTKDAIQVRARWSGPVIVLWLRRVLGETPIERGKIMRLDVSVGGDVLVDSLTAEFFHQAILMHAVVALHAAFGLRRVRAHNADAQARAHASELRQWLSSAQFLLPRGGKFLDIFSIPSTHL